jgi:hypothetical protein
MALNLGNPIRLTYAVKNDLTVLTNPASATLTITQPDGTLAAGIVVDITPDVVGQLVYDFTPVQSGLHSVHWATTGPTTAEDDTFVAEAPGRLLVSVDEAVAHLRSQQVTTSDADREQLQWLCLAATDAVEKDLGLILVRRAFTVTFDGGRYDLNLPAPPRAADGGSITIATVTENGTALTAADYVLRKQGWRLSRSTTTWRSVWAAGVENISVTGTAGCANPPPCVRFAALGEIQGAWQSSQQSFHAALEDFNPEQALARAVPGISGAMWKAYQSLRPLLHA